MNFEKLVETIHHTHSHLQTRAFLAISQSLTIRNWLLGFYLVEHEQNISGRVKHGPKMLASLVKKIEHNVNGMNEHYLGDCRLFYNTYPQIEKVMGEFSLPKTIWWTVTPKLKKVKQDTLVGASPEVFITRLTYSHIVKLIREPESLKRTFYEVECIRGNWSATELQRQMDNLLYECTSLSKDKLIKIINEKAAKLTPHDLIKNPYVFEFVGLKK